MKVVLLFALLATSAFAQDPGTFLKNFDAKIYSLKNKGVKDFVVDIESSKLTKQMNDQQIFGKVEDVVFRIYWTANPERLAIEVMGLPEGFKEIKEELKASLVGVLDNMLPRPTANKFVGYKIVAGSKVNEIIAQDPSGLAPVPSYVMRFDNQNRLIEILGQKPIGSLVITPQYEKESFSDGRWVLRKEITETVENGQSLKISKKLGYGNSQGIGVLSEIEIITEQKSLSSDTKSVTLSESIEFKNYKINNGDALKYFLGEAQLTAPKKDP